MAQKVNPIAVRLGYNRHCDSNWFSDYYYSTLVSQDFQLRRYLKRFPRCVIQHYAKRSVIYVFCLKSNKKQLLSQQLIPGVASRLAGPKSVGVATPLADFIPIQVKSIYQSASLLAQAICLKLEQNKSFRQISRTVVRECEHIKYIKGIRLVCSGRLNGAEMAKTVCHKYGESSLHVFSDRIDYASMHANTPYGILGVKVWISLK